MQYSLTLFVQFYNDPTPERNEENEKCLFENLNNPHITRVGLMKEDKTILPQWALDHPKTLVFSTGVERFTFQKGFNDAEKLLCPGEFVIFANSDIILDPKSNWTTELPRVFGSNPGKVCMCLSRHEMRKDGFTWTDPAAMMCWSQDAWVFQKVSVEISLVPPQMFKRSKFCVGGAPTCDGYMSFLCKFYGNFNVFNYGLTLKILHFDRCRGHALGNMVLNQNTDMTAKRIVDADPFIFQNQYTCPYVNYEQFIQGENVQPLNRVTNCCKQYFHIHLPDGVNIKEDNEGLKRELEERILGVQSSSQVTLKERRAMFKNCLSLMLEKKVFCDVPLDFPDGASVYTAWAHQLRHACQYQEALEKAKRALEFVWDPETCSKKEDYEHGRFHVLGIVGWYAKDFTAGKMGAETAFQARGKDIDKANLDFYSK
jgi:hypothetical protein